MCSKFMPYTLAMNVGTATIPAYEEIRLITSFWLTLTSARFASRMLVSSSRIE